MRFFQKLLTKLLVLFSSIVIHSQEVDFHPPIDAPFNLSGTFGEFRSRFHTGIDFKGGEGINIFSIEDGYISRIEVSPSGYGKVVYITHPNGYSSVYAHLSRFSPDIEKYIKSEQYRSKSYTVKKFPKKDQIQVKRGELLGYSGNTGRSFGAHLHFEIRDTNSQDALNPLMFNYTYEDLERPIIRGLYTINENNTLIRDLPKRIRISKTNDSTYVADNIIFNGDIGFGIDIYDIQYKNLFNRNGVYKVELLIDSIQKFSYSMDRIKFSENHYKKLMYDYLSLVKNNRRVLKVYIPPRSNLSFLKTNDFNGIIKSNEIINSEVNIKVTDWNNNSSYLEFKIISADTLKSNKPLNGIEILTNQKYVINKGESVVEINKNTFYEDVLLNITSKDDTIDLGDEITPFRSSIKLKIPIDENIDSLSLSQTFIGKIVNNKINYISSKINDSYITANTSSLGRYIISRDSILPEIRPINFKNKSNVKSNKTLRLRIKDDKSGIKNYKAYINGKWALFEYEPKQNLIFHDLSDSVIEDGENDLLIEFEDGVGNKQTYNTKIYY
jgi:hypothetical protein